MATTRRLTFEIRDTTAGNPAANITAIIKAVRDLKAATQGNIGTKSLESDFNRLKRVVDELSASATRLANTLSKSLRDTTNLANTAARALSQVERNGVRAGQSLTNLSLPANLPEQLNQLRNSIQEVRKGNTDAATSARLLGTAYNDAQKQLRLIEDGQKKVAAEAAKAAQAQQQAISKQQQSEAAAAAAREAARRASERRGTGFGAGSTTTPGAAGLAGAGRSADEVAKIEASLKRLRNEQEQSNRLVDDLRKAYGLTETEARKVADATGLINREAEKSSRSIGDIAKGLASGLASGAVQAVTQFGQDALRATFRSAQQAIAGSLQTFGEFDAGFTLFQSKIGDAEVDLDSLKQEIIAVASATSQTPGSLAELSAALVAVGTPANEVEKALLSVASLSDVIGDDPVLTGKTLQTGVNVFGRFGETIESVGDKINVLVNTTAAGADQGIDEFNKLFAQAGAVAANAGIEFDELGSAFAILREGGASARIASTGLRTAINRLPNPTAKAAKELKELGINAFDEEGNFVGLVSFLEEFEQKVTTLTDQEKLRITNVVFGQDGGTAVLTAIEKVGGRLQDVFDTVRNESTGSIADSLEILNQALPRQLNLLQGQLSAFSLQFGEALAPIAFTAVTALRQAVDELITQDLFGGLTDSGVRFAETIAASEPLLAAFTNSLQTLATAGSALLGNVVDLVANLAQNAPSLFTGLAASFDGIIKGLQGIGTFTILVVQQVLQAVAPIVAIAGSLINTVGGVLQAIGDGLFNVFNAFNDLKSEVTGLGNAFDPFALFIGILDGVGSLLVQVTANFFDFIVNALGGVQEWLQRNPELIEATQALFAKLGETVGNIVGAFSEFLTGGNDVANGITGALFDALFGLVGVLADLLVPALTFVVNLITSLVGIFSDAAVAAVEFFGEVTKRADGLIKRIDTVVGGFSRLIDRIRGVEEEFVGFESSSEGSGLEAGDAFVGGFVDALEGNGVGAGLGDFFSEAADGVDFDATQFDLLTSKYADLTRQQELSVSQQRENALNAGATAEELAAIEEQSLDKRLRINQQKLEELRKLQAEGGLDEDEIKKVGNEINSLELTVQNQRTDIAKAASEERTKVAQEEAQARVDALKEQQNAEKEFRGEQFKSQQDAIKEQFKLERDADKEEFGDAAERRKDQFQEARNARQKAFNEEQRLLDEQSEKEIEALKQSGADRRQQATETFEKRQQSQAEAFQKRIQRERDRANKEFGALELEVERRSALASAESAEERRAIKEEFDAEDKALQERRKLERQVLNEQRQVIAARERQGLLEDSPLQEARQESEAGFAAEEAAFNEQQQAERAAFEAEQRELDTELELFLQQLKDERELERQRSEAAFEAQQKAEEKAFNDQERELQKQFEAEQKQLDKEFNAEQRDAEKAFKNEQRQLDKQNAEAIKAILESVRPGAATPRFTGGGLEAGGLYTIAERGPEMARIGGKEYLFKEPQYIVPGKSGKVFSAGQTEKMMAMRSGSAAMRPGPNLGDSLGVKLDRLIALQQRNKAVMSNDTYVINSDRPTETAADISARRSRNLARSMGL